MMYLLIYILEKAETCVGQLEEVDSWSDHPRENEEEVQSPGKNSRSK